MSSVSIDVMNTRIEKIRAYWKFEGLPACQKAPIDPKGLAVRNADPFRSLSKGIREPMSSEELRQRALDIMSLMKDNEQFPTAMLIPGGAFDKMEAILYDTYNYKLVQRATQRPPVTQTVDAENPVRLTMLNRNKFHRQFIKDQMIGEDLNGLIRWLRVFYCGHYLKSNNQKDGKFAKAQVILKCMDSLRITEGMDVQEYLTTIPEHGSKSLAQIIGGNRLSSRTSKTPWGLEMLMKTFYYQKQENDTSAKFKLAAKTKPEECEDNNPFQQMDNIYDF